MDFAQLKGAGGKAMKLEPGRRYEVVVSANEGTAASANNTAICAIELLPEKERAAERGKLLDLIVKTRDADGTWNDRVFPRSRGYCSAMVVLALLGEQTPLPPALQKK